MRFTSDNNASACSEVLAAVLAANEPDVAYDGDALSARLDGAFSALFEREVAALWVATGTAANGIALATLCPPYRGILCHAESHINADEAGGPEFFTHGAKLITVEGEGAKLTPETIAVRMATICDDIHRVQPAALSITNATEFGLVYSPEETAELGAFARENGLRFHLDGARFANAVANRGCSPADLSWRAGVDAMTFGFIKNGGMTAEAIIFFDPDHAQEARIRRKRAGHLSSKGRFHAAQLLALLEGGRWLANARRANAAAARLAAGMKSRLVYPVQANELFVTLAKEEAATLRGWGFQFHDWSEGIIRFVVSWDQDEADVARLADAIGAL
jgi:threonine aldolase